MVTALAMALLPLMFWVNGCRTKPPRPETPKGTQETPGGKQPGDQAAPAPKISLTASPNAINFGDKTTLSWDSSNATSINIDNGIGTVEASGSRTVSPNASTTYKATATGPGGAATSEVRVTVDFPGAITPKKKDLPKLNPIEEVERNIKDVFFDYDQSSIREDARTALLANARLLAQYPDVRIIIEGHCDERGSEKYNLALGDKRANAAKDFLTQQGIDGSRINTITYGKERLFCEEHNEECWQLNRRAHFALR
jgi:peptidoglycan-associated lipoprotein